LIQALEFPNIERMETGIHPQALGFFQHSQLTVKLSRQLGVKEIAPTLSADLSNSGKKTYDSEYLVVGDTGIVCSRMVLAPPKGKKQIGRPDRVTYVYTHSGGRWVLVSWHHSATPLASQ
jgi:hypothetical protein